MNFHKERGETLKKKSIFIYLCLVCFPLKGAVYQKWHFNNKTQNIVYAASKRFLLFSSDHQMARSSIFPVFVLTHAVYCNKRHSFTSPLDTAPPQGGH